MDTYVVNLSVFSEDKALMQKTIDSVNRLRSEHVDVLFTGHSVGDYADVFQKHLKARNAFNAVSRKKEEQSEFNFVVDVKGAK